MSADLLRRAAALMRERAEAATPSPWHQAFRESRIYSSAQSTPSGGIYGHVADISSKVSAEHVASWHPAVALAVADWLEAEATAMDAMANFSGITEPLAREGFNIRGAALTVTQGKNGSLSMQADTSGPAVILARAYLGEVDA